MRWHLRVATTTAEHIALKTSVVDGTRIGSFTLEGSVSANVDVPVQQTRATWFLMQVGRVIGVVVSFPVNSRLVAYRAPADHAGTDTAGPRRAFVKGRRDR